MNQSNTASGQIDRLTNDKSVSNSETSSFYTQKAFDFPTLDTSFIASVQLIFGQDSLPQQYVSRVSTPVCNDGLCQTLDLKIYWSLIGNYLNYDTVSGWPLTKFDHLPFTGDDYVKLHQILADQNSVLERKTLDALFDRDSVRQSNTVDAVTGATAQAIKHAIVEGALYSSYTLWHVVNGEIKTKIQGHTKAIYSPELAEELLSSEDYQEQLFALKQFKDDDFEIYFDVVLNLIVASNPLLEMYILKMVPDAMWQEQTFQKHLIRTFPDLTSNGRGILFNNLSGLDAIDVSNLVFLSDHIDKMSINQLKMFFKLLAKHQGEDNEIIQDRLRAVANSMNDKAYYINEFLKWVK